MPGGASGVFMAYLDQGHIGTLTDAAGVVWKYYYDADGKRRIKSKTVNGASSITDNCSYFFYEGEDLICQQDIGDLVQDESQYEPKFLLLDHLGSTRAELVFTESGGVFSPVIQEYYDLMPYGEVIDPPSAPESVLFTGKSRDPESGVDYFGPRGHQSTLFRWMSPDQLFYDNKINLPQTWNLYTYCAGRPINCVDYDGYVTYQIVGPNAKTLSDRINWVYRNDSKFRAVFNFMKNVPGTAKLTYWGMGKNPPRYASATTRHQLRGTQYHQFEVDFYKYDSNGKYPPKMSIEEQIGHEWAHMFEFCLGIIIAEEATKDHGGLIGARNLGSDNYCSDFAKKMGKSAQDSAHQKIQLDPNIDVLSSEFNGFTESTQEELSAQDEILRLRAAASRKQENK